MIEIICKDELYTYDVYHITKAFFPEEKVTQRLDPKLDCAACVSLPGEGILKIPDEEGETGKLRKYRVGFRLYQAYAKLTGRSLAWGLLTGVRPTKIAMQKIEEGMGKEAFVSWFCGDSLVSEKKAELAYEIAQRERKILRPLDYRNGYSLYVGIPFCPSVCSYCSFSSGAIADWEDCVDAYLDALCRELSYFGSVCGSRKLNTIYIGGGTPTTLTESQLERLLAQIDRTFSKEYLLEYTVEAGRPDSITEEKLRIIKDHGISRISINPQTMQQKTLDLIGRKHTTADIRRAYAQARDIGFDNINMDLIAGLPQETAADMEDTLSQIRRMGPDSLTVHSLAIKRASKMAQEQPRLMAQEVSDMIEIAQKVSKEMNLFPYYLYRQKNIAGNFENVGYAKVDKAGIYNILIMEEKQSILAAGAGACTKVLLKEPVTVPGSKKHRTATMMRVENVKDIPGYIARIDEMIERKEEWLWR